MPLPAALAAKLQKRGLISCKFQNGILKTFKNIKILQLSRNQKHRRNMISKDFLYAQISQTSTMNVIRGVKHSGKVILHLILNMQEIYTK